MSVSPQAKDGSSSPITADDAVTLSEEIAKVRREGALGRSDLIVRLFDYLAEGSKTGRVPKEAEIAVAVFNRRPDFDANQDAVARVYIHKLRKKLSDFRDRAGQPTRLTIPLGEYRLVLADTQQTTATVATQAVPRRRVLAGVAALGLTGAVSAGAALAIAASLRSPATARLAQLRDSDIWRPLLMNGRPTFIALGDYFIFGESDNGVDPARLVREYSVGSPAELDGFLQDNPQHAGRYMDLGLRYLPVASAFALGDVVPIFDLKRSDTAFVRMLLASELNARQIKAANIVYLGLISGMGVLRQVVWPGSRFRIGESYDELIDGVTGQSYVSGGGGQAPSDAVYQDYGYFSTFSGSQGNRFVIISGTRDAAVRHTAEAATSPGEISDLLKVNRDAPGFEALYSVEGMDLTNFNGRRLLSSPLNEAKMRRPAGSPDDMVAR